MEDVNLKFLEKSDTHTHCPWKGEASYYNLSVNNEKNRDAVWFYPNPLAKAGEIKNRLAFWNGVEVVE